MASEFFVCFCMGEEKDTQRLTIENSTAWGTTECPMAFHYIHSITNLCRQDHHSLVQPQQLPNDSIWDLQPCTKLSSSLSCYHHVAVPSGVQKTSQHELVPWAPAVHSNVDVVGLVSPSCHHTQVCHFSLATHYSSNQARLLNRSPLKCYDSMNIITKEYNILLNFQHPKSHY